MDGGALPISELEDASESTRAKLGLRAKLVRVYALQVLLISVAALIGVFITYVIVEDVLTRQALHQEAEYFWALYEADPATPLPDTVNMTAYMAPFPDPDAQTAVALQTMGPGLGRVEDLPGSPLVYVSERGDLTLYLVWAEEEVSELVFYFGLAPLAAVLLTVYALLFLTYRLSHQAISPMLNLAQALERFDFRSTQPLEIPVQPDDVDRETRLMVEALTEFGTRLEQFIERERTFTRNAGHELRTPIAVMKGSLDILESTASQGRVDEAVLIRMRRVVDDMEVLLETLLMLAREEDVRAEPGETDLNQVLAEEIELHTQLAEDTRNRVAFVETAQRRCDAKPRVLAIIFGNLLRNALNYTREGTVRVEVLEDRFVVADDGVGMSEAEADKAFTAFFRGANADELAQGQGLGLALVRRLVQQLGWRVAFESEVGRGTTFTVWFR